MFLVEQFDRLVTEKGYTPQQRNQSLKEYAAVNPGMKDIVELALLYYYCRDNGL